MRNAPISSERRPMWNFNLLKFNHSQAANEIFVYMIIHKESRTALKKNISAIFNSSFYGLNIIIQITSLNTIGIRYEAYFLSNGLRVMQFFSDQLPYTIHETIKARLEREFVNKATLRFNFVQCNFDKMHLEAPILHCFWFDIEINKCW